MQDKFRLKMGGVEYWLEGGTYDELNAAAISMLRFKFAHRAEKDPLSYSPAESAAMLQPFRLFRAIDTDGDIGDLIEPEG